MRAWLETAGVGLFIGLTGALLVATLAEMLAYLLLGHAAWIELNPGFHLAGNLAFGLALALFVTGIRRLRLLSIGSILAVVAFLILVAGLVFTGAMTFERSPALGALLMSPVGTIGVYPPGPDMPLDYGLGEWAKSALVPIGLGLALGAAGRRLRRS
jgi:hypothetical protein